jgi:hypothetical protein
LIANIKGLLSIDGLAHFELIRKRYAISRHSPVDTPACSPTGIKDDSEFYVVLLLRGFLSNQPEDVGRFVNSLSVLIDLALFKLYGFFTDDALWTPLAFGYIFGSLNYAGHLMPPGRDSPYISLA